MPDQVRHDDAMTFQESVKIKNEVLFLNKSLDFAWKKGIITLIIKGLSYIDRPVSF